MKHVFLLAIASIASINISQANCIDFWKDGQVCLSIRAVAVWDSFSSVWSTFIYSVDTTNNITSPINCDVLTPDWIMTNIWACNWSFSYGSNSNQILKFYIKLGNQYKIWTFSFAPLNGDITMISSTIKPTTSIPSSRYNSNLTFGQSKSINDVIKLWPVLISTLKVRFPKLNTNTTWQSQADILSIEMQKLVNGTTPRVYSNYKSFRDGLISFVQYTITQR